MSLTDAAGIPGYAEAVEREQACRDLAFVGYDVPLCGRPARQFTIRHWLLLLHCDNAFVTGAVIEPADVAMFLWFVSPQFSLDAAERAKFIKEVSTRVEFAASIVEIRAYLDGAFIDAPPHGGAPAKPYYSSATSLIAMIAGEYGWDDEAIMDKPLARIFQYAKEIIHRSNPRLPQFNPSDVFISRWLANRNTQTASTNGV